MARSCQSSESLCYNCHQPGHQQKDCTESSSCHKCGSADHIARNCDQEEHKSYGGNRGNRGGRGGRGGNRSEPGVCYQCNEAGHIARDCPTGKKEKLITAEEETEAATTVEKLDTFPGTVIKREKKGMEGILGSATNAKKSDIWQKTVHLKVRLI
jgi:Arginine methyltransferase-interacting protein, contains RING Zn-finger